LRIAGPTLGKAHPQLLIVIVHRLQHLMSYTDPATGRFLFSKRVRDRIRSTLCLELEVAI
jgi:hypothetical protein